MNKIVINNGNYKDKQIGEGKFIYNRISCVGIAVKYGGDIISAKVTSDQEKYTWKCKYHHTFDEYAHVLDKREYFCPICERRNDSKDIDAVLLSYILESLTKQAFDIVLKIDDVSFLVPSGNNKTAYFLIAPKFYNHNHYSIVSVLKKDYLKKGYNLREIDSSIPKHKIVEYIIDIFMPEMIKMVEYYTNLMCNERLPNEFNIRSFVYDTIKNKILPGYKLTRYNAFNIVPELKIGWIITYHNNDKHVNEAYISLEKDKPKTLIKLLYIRSDMNKKKNILTYLVSNFKNMTSEKIFEGSMEKYIDSLL